MFFIVSCLPNLFYVVTKFFDVTIAFDFFQYVVVDYVSSFLDNDCLCLMLPFKFNFTLLSLAYYVPYLLYFCFFDVALLLLIPSLVLALFECLRASVSCWRFKLPLLWTQGCNHVSRRSSPWLSPIFKKHLIIAKRLLRYHRRQLSNSSS